ncbi:MAG: HAMP domain-containing sensor histidine kinase [Lachnospiraceae bacterium]|nr:HAMP domain-containing sensor histidine kinase [Lachnospiraceae bacterium]
MKHSIQKQLIGAFVGMMVLALTIIGVVNYCFLQPYYTAHKEKKIMEAYDTINDIKDASVDFSGTVRQIASKNNLSILITSSDFVPVNSTSRDTLDMARRLFGYYTSLYKDKLTVLEQTGNYVMQTSEDQAVKLQYLEMWGVLDSGNFFIIRTPLESIEEAASMSNTFYVCVGIVMILLSSVSIWIFARRFTRPVMELTEISKKMTGLDFEAKYVSRGSNEIDELGENFNTMSSELEGTISELKSANVELQKDIEKKTQIDEVRKEFLNNVSHELKTPIALIQGYAEGLKENINEDAENRDFYCDVIMDESAKMNNMVKKLLTLNQLEFGNDQIVMERFDIVNLIRGVLQSMDILIQQKEARVSFEYADPIYVWGDEFKVEEVVTNFMTNALNHLDYDKKIDVKILEQEGTVRVSVFNTGDPIPDEDIDKIWIKFYKVDKARTREYGGSGIGLSIVKAIMDGMNQTCGAKNYDNGVEFWFTLESK